MFPRLIPLIFLAAACQSGAVAGLPENFAPRGTHHVLLVLDGLRPDYVTPELMPHLHAAAAEGVWFESHHAVYPTVTRVNAPSIVTGAPPGVHGLMDNAIYVPEVSESLTLSTGDHRNLRRVRRAAGKLLTAPTLGELLAAAGKRLLVCSSGSTGSAFLLDPELAGAGIINTGFTAPEALAVAAAEALGPPPDAAYPNTARNRYAMDAYLTFGLEREEVDAAIIWLTDPDHTAHRYGMGASRTNAAIRAVDAELGRLLAAWDARGMRDRANLLVTSDHGFSTLTGNENPLSALYAYMGRAGRPMTDVVLAGFGVHFKRDAEALTFGLVRELQGAEWAGSLYTPAAAPGDARGIAPGTLSMELIGYEHPRRPDILFAPAWGGGKNEHGYAGTSALPGTAGHGTDSPHDIHNTLVALGPDFKQDLRSGTPSGNLDLAPTLCALAGIAAPETMRGRILAEALRGGPDPDDMAVSEARHTAETTLEDGTRYRMELVERIVNGTRYHAYTRTERIRPGGPAD